ncbi:hypothetical protein SmJEL517_g03348 [Synchytrium microbalum]|uniref:RING-type domain-containing protein n=1 Tax=Synchytrium microbalum TaxID=1806994 RepID=A0A507C8J8_9FUNG|nr:uncharacterized protein SmJEL517_g03348 [Synchytrium microbalum]TPX33825.1 hypothetical protein SmJEL517_g03348 [Synchytrium microbalum]
MATELSTSPVALPAVAPAPIPIISQDNLPAPRRSRSTPVGKAANVTIATPPPKLIRIQLFPHTEHHRPNHLSRSDSDLHFSFSPIEKDLKPGTLIKIGRKVDRKREREPTSSARHASASHKHQHDDANGGSKSTTGTTGAERSKTLTERTNHVGSPPSPSAVTAATQAGLEPHVGGMVGGASSDVVAVDTTTDLASDDVLSISPPTSSATLRRLSAGPSAFRLPNRSSLLPTPNKDKETVTATSLASHRKVEFVAFRSKVVSRTHAEIWIGADGQVYFRDVGSSSGSFLNRLRLSPSGKESRPYPVKSGDIIQLGVDYQGRQEDIYKSVMIKIFITVQSGNRPKPNAAKLRAALRSLLGAMNGGARDDYATTDCCICLCAISTNQALFLAPCSHCFHYKCVIPLLGSALMFQCPLCRQVANLEASVTGEDSQATSSPQLEDVETKDVDIEEEEEKMVDGTARWASLAERGAKASRRISVMTVSRGHSSDDYDSDDRELPLPPAPGGSDDAAGPATLFRSPRHVVGSDDGHSTE